MLPGNPEKEVFFLRAAARRQPVMEASANWVFPFHLLCEDKALADGGGASQRLDVVWEPGARTLTLFLPFRGTSNVKSAYPSDISTSQSPRTVSSHS